LTCGAVLAIVALLLAPPAAKVVVIVAVALVGLALLGWLGAAAQIPADQSHRSRVGSDQIQKDADGGGLARPVGT
jgi:hypothetical protein